MTPRLPPLLALRAFEAAGRLLSFTLAAQELHLTQGAISRQVRLLEDFLKQKLFVRLTRRVELTEAGGKYLEAVQQALGIVADATRKCLAESHRILTIDVLPTLGAYWLMPRLAHFNELHPDVEVHVISSIEPANLKHRGADMAIRVGRFPGKRYGPLCPRIDLELAASWNEVEAYPLFDDILVPVLSRPLAEQAGPVRHPRDLLRFRLLNNATRKNAWKDWFFCHGISLPEDGEMLDYGHFFMTLQAAKEGKGVALVPSVIYDHLPEGDGLICPVDAPVASAGEYHLLVRTSAQADPAVVALRDWLLSQATGVAARNAATLKLPAPSHPSAPRRETAGQAGENDSVASL